MSDGYIFMNICEGKESSGLTYKEVAVELFNWWGSTSVEEHQEIFNCTGFIDAFTTYSLDEIMRRLKEYKDSILQIGDEIAFKGVQGKTFVYLGNWSGNSVFKDLKSGEILVGCNDDLQFTKTGRVMKFFIEEKVGD